MALNILKCKHLASLTSNGLKQACLSVKGPRMCVFIYARVTFLSCDLDLDSMTLIYELDLDILKMYPRTKTELSRLSFSTV